MCESARTLMNELPPEQRRALEMAFFEGMTHSEIAAVTGLPLGTVKTRIRSALATLKKGLGEEGRGRPPEMAPPYRASPPRVGEGRLDHRASPSIQVQPEGMLWKCAKSRGILGTDLPLGLLR
jgi:hypothetical protein